MDTIENETKEDEVLPEVPYQSYMETTGVIRDQILRESYDTLIKGGTFTNSFSIPDLKGETDKFYRLVIKGRSGGSFVLGVGFNNDVNVNNYRTTAHRVGWNGGLSINDVLDYSLGTNGYLAVGGGKTDQWLEMIIAAEKGGVRMAQGREMCFTDANNNYMWNSIGIWTNTTDEITSIEITLGAPITAGTYWLYKTKS